MEISELMLRKDQTPDQQREVLAHALEQYGGISGASSAQTIRNIDRFNKESLSEQKAGELASQVVRDLEAFEKASPGALKDLHDSWRTEGNAGYLRNVATAVISRSMEAARNPELKSMTEAQQSQAVQEKWAQRPHVHTYEGHLVGKPEIQRLGDSQQHSVTLTLRTDTDRGSYDTKLERMSADTQLASRLANAKEGEHVKISGLGVHQQTEISFPETALSVKAVEVTRDRGQESSRAAQHERQSFQEHGR